jgi:putative two-component system response regulator
VDVYDAMAQPRVYQDAATHHEIVALISGGRGTAFDPDVVDAFLDVEEEFRRLAGRLPGHPPRESGGASSG